MKTRRIALGALVAAYLVGFGMIAGVAIDRMRYDRERSEVLGRYEKTLRDWQGYRMALEKSTEGQR